MIRLIFSSCQADGAFVGLHPILPFNLSLGTLTEFSLIDYFLALHLDTPLSFLGVQRQTPARSGLRCLLALYEGTAITRALISNIALRRGSGPGNLSIRQWNET